jgi:hypothetical protein
MKGGKRKPIVFDHLQGLQRLIQHSNFSRNCTIDLVGVDGAFSKIKLEGYIFHSVVFFKNKKKQKKKKRASVHLQLL